MLSLTTADRATATTVMTAKRIMRARGGDAGRDRPGSWRPTRQAPTAERADDRGRASAERAGLVAGERQPRPARAPPGRCGAAARPRSVGPPRQRRAERAARCRRGGGRRRPGRSGSSTISAPLSSAAAASAAKPMPDGDAGDRPRRRAGRRAGTRTRARPATRGTARTPPRTAPARRWPTSAARLSLVGGCGPPAQGAGAAPAGSSEASVHPRATSSASSASCERIHRDHLEIVSDGGLRPRRTRRTAPGTPHIRHFGQRAPSAAPADRSDGAVEVHRAGDRDPVPAGELARGEHVDDGQREREAGRGPADVARVDRHVHSRRRTSGARGRRSAPRATMPMTARVGSSGAAIGGESAPRRGWRSPAGARR